MLASIFETCDPRAEILSGDLSLDVFAAKLRLVVEGKAPVRRFMEVTGLVSNDLFMRTIEVALKVIPRIGEEKKRMVEEKVLLDLWLAMDEIKGKVKVYDQLELPFGQLSLKWE